MITHVTLLINAPYPFLSLFPISLKMVLFLKLNFRLLHYHTALLFRILYCPVQAKAMLSMLAATALDMAIHQSLLNKSSNAHRQLSSLPVLLKNYSLNFPYISGFSTDAHDTTIDDERLAHGITKARFKFEAPSIVGFHNFLAPSSVSAAYLSS